MTDRGPTASEAAGVVTRLTALRAALRTEARPYEAWETIRGTLDATVELVERSARALDAQRQSADMWAQEADRRADQRDAAEAARDEAITYLRDAAVEAHDRGLLREHNDGTSWDQVPWERCASAVCQERRAFLDAAGRAGERG